MLAVVLGLAALLAVEVMLARRGDRLDGEPLDLDGAVGEGRSGPPLSMVWLGDSTAAGVGVDRPADSLPVRVAGGLDRPVDLVVLAESGARVDDVLDLQLPALARLDAPPDVVLVSVGSNDLTHVTSLDAFEERYRRVVDALPEQALVVLLGIPDFGSVPRLAQPLRFLAELRGEQLDEVVAEVAASTEARYVDIAAETGPAFRADPSRHFSADDYHPSAGGYALWAAAVLEVLRPAIMQP